MIDRGKRRPGFRRTKAVVNAVLKRMGLRLSWAGGVVIDLRGIAGDPLEGAYRAGPYPFVLDVPLAHCRILPAAGFACVAGCGNPFVDSLVAFARGEAADYETSPLVRFYRAWQPQNAAEVLGLEGPDVSPLLRQAPPLGFVMPWNVPPPGKSLSHWQTVVAADHREHGARLDAALGWKAWGPVAPAVGRLEFRRLRTVHESIRRRGYRRSNAVDGDIGGVVLHSGQEDYRVLVTRGHHRAAALAALGYETAPVRVGQVVRRAEVAAWPNVRSGLFTPQQALAVFDRLFAARQPPRCRWPE